MIRAVPGQRVSNITSAIPSVSGRQAAKAVWGKQLSFDGVYDRFRALSTQHGVRQARGQNLIGPHRSVRAAVKNAVVETRRVVVPEQIVEALLRKIGHG